MEVTVDGGSFAQLLDVSRLATLPSNSVPSAYASRRPQAAEHRTSSLPDEHHPRGGPAAIAQYDSLGQDAFLDKYGFDPARSYCSSTTAGATTPRRSSAQRTATSRAGSH